MSPTATPSVTPTPTSISAECQAELYILSEKGSLYRWGQAAPIVSSRDVKGSLRAFSISPTGNGFSLFNSGGALFHFGDAVRKLTARAFGGGTGCDFEILPGQVGTLTLSDWGPVYATGTARTFGAPYFGTAWHPLSNARDLEVTASGQGYYVLDCWGNVHAYGDAAWLGDLDAPEGGACDLEITPDGLGYVILDVQGQVTGFGSAQAAAESLRPGGFAPGALRNETHFDCCAADLELKVDCQTQAIEGWWILGREGSVVNVGLADVPAPAVHPIGAAENYRDLEIYIRNGN